MAQVSPGEIAWTAVTEKTKRTNNKNAAFMFYPSNPNEKSGGRDVTITDVERDGTRKNPESIALRVFLRKMRLILEQIASSHPKNAIVILRNEREALRVDDSAHYGYW